MLTERKRRFAEEYVVDMNGAAAAVRSGYAAKTAKAQASRALRDTAVAALVKSLRKKQTGRTEATADWIVAQLVKEAAGKRADTTQGSRVRALELLGKRVNLFPPQKVAFTDPEGKESRLGVIIVPAKDLAAYGIDSNGGVETHAAPD